MQNHDRRRVFVTGGDSAVSFSGCARFFMAGLAREMPDADVLPVPIHSYRELFGATALWGATRRVDPRRYFFMTRQFQDANWSINRFGSRPGDILVSFLPVLVGTATFDRRFLYVDMTFSQYLTYGQFADIPARIRAELIAQERASYAVADRIFAFTGEVRRQLVESYGIAEDRIEVIGRGLNLPERAALPPLRESAAPRDRGPGSRPALRIGFVGHDFERKGLLELVDALDADDELRSAVHVEVVGPEPGLLPDRPFLTAHGYIDKDTRMAELLAVMDRCDLGYLFSKSEGIPGSVMEFLSRGVPCIVSDIAPMRSLAGSPGIIALPLSGGAAAVHDALRSLLLAPARLRDLKAAAAGSTLEGWRDQARAVAAWCRAAAVPGGRRSAA